MNAVECTRQWLAAAPVEPCKCMKLIALNEFALRRDLCGDTAV